MNTRPALYVVLALLMVVSIIELSFISSMVGWLHHRASGTFAFNYGDSVHALNGHPKNFILNQGHTSNGASGTAFILIGIGGFLVLWLSSRPRPSKFSFTLYHIWLVANVLSLLLTFASLIYVFAVVNDHRGQNIDPSIAAGLNGQAYYVDSWTPQNWFPAILRLDLANSSDRSNINYYLHIIKGWQYNLIPFFIIHLFETCIALWDYMQHKRQHAPPSNGWQKNMG